MGYFKKLTSEQGYAEGSELWPVCYSPPLSIIKHWYLLYNLEIDPSLEKDFKVYW